DGDLEPLAREDARQHARRHPAGGAAADHEYASNRILHPGDSLAHGAKRKERPATAPSLRQRLRTGEGEMVSHPLAPVPASLELRARDDRVPPIGDRPLTARMEAGEAFIENRLRV